MNWSKINYTDIANGPGVRVSLFVSGCEHHCKGCFNPETHDPCSGYKFTDDVKSKIFEELSKPYISGLSLLGGDPLSKLSDNRKVIFELCKDVKEKFPNKDIWIWTGFVIEDLKNDISISEILKYADVIIDGPFVENLKEANLIYKGSSNQRVIYTNKDIFHDINK